MRFVAPPCQGNSQGAPGFEVSRAEVRRTEDSRVAIGGTALFRWRLLRLSYRCCLWPCGLWALLQCFAMAMTLRGPVQAAVKHWDVKHLRAWLECVCTLGRGDFERYDAMNDRRRAGGSHRFDHDVDEFVGRAF